jgi:hypothetical protein
VHDDLLEKAITIGIVLYDMLATFKDIETLLGDIVTT